MKGTKKLPDRFVETGTDIPGVTIIKRHPFKDQRGLFERLICTEELVSWGNRPIKQVNRSFTQNKGTIRGLHFQLPPYSDCKLVACIKGRVLDVTLDLRPKSPTFGKNFSIELSRSNNTALLVPEGCAHGFQTLTNNVELIYVHSKFYSSSFEDGIDSLDEDLGIIWPLPCTARSERDKKLNKFNWFKDQQIDM